MKQILKEARAKIEKGWIQGAFARRSDNTTCTASDKDACQWCLVGGLLASCDDAGSLFEVLEAIGNVEEVATFRATKLTTHIDAIEKWNDSPSRTKKEVLAVLDKAIESAKDEQ